VSEYDYVFLAPIEPASLPAVASELSSLLGVRFVEDAKLGFLFATDEVALELDRHEFETDRDMVFDEYPYVITVRKIGRDAAFQTAYAHQVFDKLAASRRYRLLLTTGLQEEVDSFDPGHARA
jgi:hypothetical protein